MRTILNILRALSISAALAVVLAGAHSATTSPSPSVAMESPARAPSSGKDSADRPVFTAAESARHDDAGAERDAAAAKAIFETMQATYRHLDGVTIRVGVTPEDREAVAYYTEGDILISRTHTVSIDKILAHEVWHIIDWRDNGRLDWGERLPPSNAEDYLIR